MNHRVVLAEDNFLVREGVRGMLATAASVEVVASCGDLAEALEAIDEPAAGRGADRHPNAARSA